MNADAAHTLANLVVGTSAVVYLLVIVALIAVVSRVIARNR